MESAAPQTEYPELLDLQALTTFVAAKHAEILEDSSCKNTTKIALIDVLLEEANNTLSEGSIENASAIMAAGDTILGADINGEYMYAIDDVTGRYVGYAHITNEAEDGTLESKLFHQMHLGSEEVNTVFCQSREDRFALLPIESSGLIIAEPLLATQSNENWLKCICRPISAPGGVLDPQLIHDVYGQIINARSRFSTQKNIDWMLDRLNFIVNANGPGRRLEIDATEFIMTIVDDSTPDSPDGVLPDQEFSVTVDQAKIIGELLGFCTVRDYIVYTEKNGDERIEYVDGPPLLAMALDVSDVESTRTIRVPLRSCSDIT